jgi:hypothetical protein
VVSKLGGAILEDAHGHPDDFRANAIARQQDNLLFLTGHNFATGRASKPLLSREVAKGLWTNFMLPGVPEGRHSVAHGGSRGKQSQ